MEVQMESGMKNVRYIIGIQIIELLSKVWVTKLRRLNYHFCFSGHFPQR